jgi:hypothetical protein
VIVSNGDFRKSDQAGLPALGDKSHSFRLQKLIYLERMLVVRTVWPKVMTQAQPTGFVGWPGLADAWRWHVAVLATSFK